MRTFPRWVVLGVVILLVIGAGVYFAAPQRFRREFIELAVHGGDRKLREDLRPVEQGARVLIFALDGVGADEFHEAIRSGKVPHIQSLLGAEIGEGVFEHGYAAPDATSILPSTTMAAWSSVYTGEPPARTGVPGNE